jgi:DNA-binding NarL/FixJ family response regulator
MITEAPSTAAEILLLAEDADEVTLIRRAVETNRLNVVQRCPAVLSFLRRQDEYSDSPRPDLILLDVDLSRKEDCQMLEQIKMDDDFKRIPVVVLASDDAYERISQAYDLHANAYILKPGEQQEFIRVIRATLNFWLKLARLPRA